MKKIKELILNRCLDLFIWFSIMGRKYYNHYRMGEICFLRIRINYVLYFKKYKNKKYSRKYMGIDLN